MKAAFNRPMMTTVGISLLLHLLVFLDVLFSQSPLYAKITKENKTIEVVMQQPQQEEDRPPPPEHNEDDPTKANNQNGVAEQKKAQKPKASRAPSEAQTAAKPSNAINTNRADKQLKNKQLAKLKAIFGEELEVSEHETETNSSTNELDESALDETLVVNPLSEDEEALKRWYNEVYKRLSAQVAQVWVKPEDSSKLYRGVIRLNIDLQGYLNSAWIHLPSGDKALDQSALMAVKSIIRYQLPESPNMARYYQNLEFRYSGG